VRRKAGREKKKEGHRLRLLVGKGNRRRGISKARINRIHHHLFTVAQRPSPYSRRERETGRPSYRERRKAKNVRDSVVKFYPCEEKGAFLSHNEGEEKRTQSIIEPSWKRGGREKRGERGGRASR